MLETASYVFAQLGRPDDGIACLDAAIALDPSNLRVLERRVGALVEREDLVGAVADLTTAAGSVEEGSSQHADILTYRSDLLVRLERYGEAEVDLKLAIAFAKREMRGDPSIRWGPEVLHTFRRQALLTFGYAGYKSRLRFLRSVRVGRFAEAVARLDAFVSAYPDGTGVDEVIERGDLLTLLGRPVAAIAAYEEALALEWDPSRVVDRRSRTLRRLGRLEQALNADPDPTERALILTEMGHGPDALEAIELALNASSWVFWGWRWNPSPADRARLLEARARIWSDSNVRGMALSQYEATLTLWPAYHPALLGYARLMAREGRYRDAFAALVVLVRVAPHLRVDVAGHPDLRALADDNEFSHAFQTLVAPTFTDRMVQIVSRFLGSDDTGERLAVGQRAEPSPTAVQPEALPRGDASLRLRVLLDDIRKKVNGVGKRSASRPPQPVTGSRLDTMLQSLREIVGSPAIDRLHSVLATELQPEPQQASISYRTSSPTGPVTVARLSHGVGSVFLEITSDVLDRIGSRRWRTLTRQHGLETSRSGKSLEIPEEGPDLDALVWLVEQEVTPVARGLRAGARN